MRPSRSELAIVAVGLATIAAALVFPPWRAVGVSSTSYWPLRTERDFARMRLGIPPDTGWSRTDTLNWTIPFAAVFDRPSTEDALADDEFSRRLEAVNSDPFLPEELRDTEIEVLAEEYSRRRDTRIARARLPARFRQPEVGTDTIAGQVYSVIRKDRFDFSIDYARLTLQVAALAVASAAFLIVARIWQSGTMPRQDAFGLVPPATYVPPQVSTGHAVGNAMQSRVASPRARRWALWTAVLVSLNPAMGATLHLANGIAPADGWADFLAKWLLGVILLPISVYAGVWVIERLGGTRK